MSLKVNAVAVHQYRNVMTILSSRIPVFWLGLAVVLVIAGSLRLMSYRFSLPFQSVPNLVHLGGS